MFHILTEDPAPAAANEEEEEEETARPLETSSSR
jgi:hypothetical protein